MKYSRGETRPGMDQNISKPCRYYLSIKISAKATSMKVMSGHESFDASSLSGSLWHPQKLRAIVATTVESWNPHPARDVVP